MSFPRAIWRLILDPPAPGAWNMAVDEAILESNDQGKSLPTLRLYAWDPPCLSLGYSQPFSEADLQALERNGWDLVRRPTGGRAILHTDELTYSVSGSQEEPRLAGSVLESYRILSGAILEALRLLHIPAVSLPEPAAPGETAEAANGNSNPVCFEVPSHYEITVTGKKLVGSAQARRKRGVLQHGSLPLYGDLTRITQALVFHDANARQRAAERLLTRATTAEQILGQPLAWESAAQAFLQAFSQGLNLELQAGELSPAEKERAAQLAASKYAHASWTRRL